MKTEYQVIAGELDHETEELKTLYLYAGDSFDIAEEIFKTNMSDDMYLNLHLVQVKREEE